MTSTRLIAAAIGLMIPLVLAAGASAATSHRRASDAQVTTATYDVQRHHTGVQTVDYRRHYHPRRHRHYSHRRHHR
jgi:hypothetical protein